MTSKDILKELGHIDPNWIEKADPDKANEPTENKHGFKIFGKPRRAWPIPKKLAVCIASFALILCVMSVIGFGNVYAAVRNFFSLIPGVGIETIREENLIYTYETTRGTITSGEQYAKILRASFTKGTLGATVLVNKGISSEDIRLFINGKRYQTDPQNTSYMLAYSSDSSMLEIALSVETPTADDLYEIEVSGFEDRLAFTMKPCETYEDLCEIGPTVTKNGIALTVTAERTEEELVVWCYETRFEDAPNDHLANIGKPSNGSYELQRYLETENGTVYEKHEGWQLKGRIVYELSEQDESAVLCIPYLAMLRDESGCYKLDLPKTYTTVKTDYTEKTSLGTIKITSIERTPDEDNKDRIRLTFDYENKYENQAIYGILYSTEDNIAAYYCDSTSGTMEYIDIWVDKEETKTTLSFDGIYYYLTDEYRFELDLTE